MGVQTKDTYAWYGIPYAKPPVANRRFKFAAPVVAWDGIYDASKYKACCPQANMKNKQQSEDCLTLNIWSPAAGGPKKAVLFYIHGGSFCSGSGNEAQYNGRRLAERENVVVVTFNYRLGALGFLDFSFMDSSFQANCGLSDVVAALRWVYENIGAFGGDKQNITVVGQSAGAIITSALLVMPAAMPYISRAIMMSGGPVWMHTKENAQQIAREFLAFMNISTPGQLRSIPAELLVEKQKKFISCCRQGEGTFSVEVDGDFVPEFPIPASQRGGCGIPVLIGNTMEELSFASRDWLSRFMFIKDIGLKIIKAEPLEIRNRIVNAYKKYGKKAQGTLISDYIFKLTSLWYAQTRNAFANTWMYRFDYAPAILKLTDLNAIHSVDISFLFGNHNSVPAVFMFLFFPAISRIKRVTGELQRDFTTFAKTGKLNWPRCIGNKTPAKCYDINCSIKPMMEPSIVERHEKSEFKKKCFAGIPVNNSV